MKIVIDIPEYIYNTAVKGGFIYSMYDNKVINAIANGKLLTKNEIICEEVKVHTADGEKITALLDKSRMLLWRGWITAELAKKAFGWKMEDKDADSN